MRKGRIITSTINVRSRTLYWWINNVKEHNINIPNVKSRKGNNEKITIFSKRRTVKKLTAEIVSEPMINQTNKYITK